MDFKLISAMADLLMVSTSGNPRTFPNMELAQALYVLEVHAKTNNVTGIESLRSSVLKMIEDDNMVSLYRSTCEKYSWSIDEEKVETMRVANAAELEKFDVQQAEASTRGGDMEIIESLIARARFLTRTGEWSAAYAVYDDILSRPKTVTGKKLDAMMEKCRIALFQSDIVRLKVLLPETKKAIETGGDWDRRNRLKVYEALAALFSRDFRGASTLLVDCIATFTCVELCSYEQFIFYAVVTAVVSLSRPELHKKLIVNPQVIAVLRDTPILHRFLHSLYNCEYAALFEAIMYLYPQLQSDRFFGTHCSFLLRELRVLSYSQFLEAYRSVKMTSMASAFGISLELLDAELARFIATGRINAKVDKVGDTVVTNRPDAKNAQYQDTIKKGDHLLNQIQRLVRVLDV